MFHPIRQPNPRGGALRLSLAIWRRACQGQVFYCYGRERANGRAYTFVELAAVLPPYSLVLAALRTPFPGTLVRRDVCHNTMRNGAD